MSAHKQYSILFPLTAIALAGALLISACGPSLDKGQAESELVNLVLDLVIRHELRDTGAYSQAGGHTWAEAPAGASLIVWAPSAGSLDDAPPNFLNTDEPSRVWWYADHQLVEVTDKAEAIRAFRQLHFSGPSSNEAWGYYEFGILSLSGGNRSAQVYVGVSCGPLCGHGTIYTLQRNGSGQWDIKDIQPRWIS